MKMSYKIIFVFIASIFLFGCAHHEYFKKVQVMTADDYKASYFIKKLQNEGVKVAVSKDEQGNSKIELLVSAENIFNHDSANLNSQAYTILDNIVELFALYEEEVVEVVCNQNGEEKSSALASARAQQVVDYLWEEDIDASFMYADKTKQIPKGYIKIGFQNYRRQL